MTTRITTILTAFLLIATISVSCGKREEPRIRQQINVIFSPGGLGDMGYNDLILTGFQKIRMEYTDVDMIFHMPDSIPQARNILTDLLSRTDSTGTDRKLLVLAGSDYEAMLTDVWESGGNGGFGGKEILLIESVNPDSLPIYYRKISTFGASYLAGICAARECGDRPALVVTANNYDEPVLSAAEGFAAGWSSVSSCGVDTVCMATDWTGFIMSEEAYTRMSGWSKEYGFVFPVAGGTNNGIYKYLREHPGEMKTAGMDVDQTHLCSDIIGSVLKHIDNMVYDVVREWIFSGTINTVPYCGISDGYSEWLGHSFVGDKEVETATRLEEEYESR